VTQSFPWPQHPHQTLVGPADDIVVVGGGVASHRCLFDLRRHGYRGNLTLISEELYLPYDRTLLSKDMLEEDVLVEPFLLSDATEYRAAGIDLHLGVKATWLDTSQRRIGLNDGTSRPFDRLVLAVGGSPVLPPDLDVPGVLVVRQAAGLDNLRRAMSAGGRMVVIGGGFIGGEVATAAVKHDMEVTLVEAAAQPLAPVFGEDVGQRVATLHRENGVTVRCGSAATTISANPSGYVVEFNDGSSLEADSVVVGVGMRPNTDWILDSGIEIDRGIITDSICQTSCASVFAAGDCARWWHPGYAELCRVEHWDTANRHGAAVAKAVAGERQEFAPVPFFWSTQHGIRFQFAGRTASWDDIRINDESTNQFSACYYTAGVLTGALVVNQPRVFARLRRELGMGMVKVKA